MASYTDTIPTFNPYVKQLPIEAMAEVGMYKQQKYDEGIQKIQTNIDNIAGLDVVRDVDKAYLQSKLNQLGNNLTTVAAGDFSNFQLVNSVNGMTNQISKDPNVLNAVASSSTYRKGLADMAAANKDGKGSASHDWLFKTDANDWLNSGDLNKSFTGGYTQYSNYKKNGIEVIKALVKNETTKDVSLEYDANGNVVGVLDATTRTKIAGITPERIQAALMAGLSSSDFRSMQIDGRYNYSNSTPDQFVNDTNNLYKDNYDKYKQQRDVFANSLNSTSSVPVKKQIQDKIDSLDRTLNSISSEYGNITKSFANGDVESAKAKLHTTNWMNQFSQAFANQELSQTDETNAYQQPKQYRETKDIEWRKWSKTYEQNERQFAANYGLAERKVKIDEAKEAREVAASAGYGGVNFSVDQKSLPEVTLGKLKADIDLDQLNLDKKDNDIISTFSHQKDRDKGKAWLDQQHEAWEKSPGSVDALLRDHFNQTDNTKRDMFANQSMITDIEKQVSSKYPDIYKTIPGGSKPVTIKFANGGSYTYSPQEMVDFNSKRSNYMQASGSAGGGGGYSKMIYNDALAKKELSDKEYYLYKAQKDQSTPTQKTLAANLQNYNIHVNMPYSKIIQEKNKFVATEVQNRIMAMQGVEYGIPLNNEAQKTTFGNNLQAWADLADTQGGKLPFSPKMNTSSLRAIAGDLQNANVRIVEGTRYAPAVYEVTAADKKGTTQTFRIPAEDYNSVFGGKFDIDPKIDAARKYTSQMIRTDSNTTAFDGGVTTPTNSFLGNIDFPNLKHFPISGNVVKSQGSNLYSIRLNLTDPITKKITPNVSYPANGLIQENKISDALQGLTDSEMFQMIYNRNPTAKELELIKQGSQNPH